METQSLDRLLCLLEVRLNAVGLCEVASGWRLRLPCPDAVLVHYILKGSGQVSTADGAPVPFRPGTLVFLSPRCGEHEISGPGDQLQVAEWKAASRPLGEGMVSFRAGEGAPEIVSACGTISADCGGLDIFDKLRDPIVEDVSGSAALDAAFSLMLEELQSPRFGTRSLLEALMKQCVVIATRAQVERGELTLLSLPGLRDTRLMKALLEMLEHPARDHSLDELARVSGMSRSVFAERFAEAFQRPPIDMLKQVRLHRAANLLRNTRLPIQIIAMTVGYSSRSYFSRAFRSAYGTDPRSFREEARETPQHRREERQNA
jgi:AraC-like DNA-binding protein